MNKPILYFFILLSLAFAGCETLVNDVDPSRLPKSDNKLVVHGYLAPQDTLLEINVRSSSPVTGPNGRFFGSSLVSLSNATVTIFNQNRSVNLLLDPKQGNYTTKASNMPILAGQTYNLKVTLGSLSVESSCTIPQAVPIKEVREDSVAAQSFGSLPPNVVRPKDRTYRVFWDDPAGQVNYYRVSGYLYEVQRFQTGMNQFQERPQITSISFRNSSQSGDLYADAQRDGTLMASATGLLSSFWFGNNPVVPNTRRIQLSLITCDKAYYDYHRLVNSFDGDNPFSEPTLIPTNIKGGFGCFAGYNRTDFLVKTR